jgi:hypothetical protein
MRKVANKRNMDLYDFRALMHDPVDLSGIPTTSPDGKHTIWLRPSFLPELTDNNKDERGIFFIDELNAASPSMQALCYQVVHDRRAGEHLLHPGWIPMAAGNYDTDGAVTNKMPTPLKSRFIHLNIGLEPPDANTGVRRLVNQGKWNDEWIEWGLSEGKIHPLVIAYHRFTGGSDLYAFSKTSQTFPCLRTWEFVSNVLKTKPSSNLLFPLLAGCINEGYAAKMYAFVQDSLLLPDLDELLKNPEKTPLPKNGQQRYALVTALSAKLVNMEGKEFQKAFSQALIFVERLEGDMQILSMKDVFYSVRKNDVGKNSDFRRWACGPVGAALGLVNKLD